MSNRWVARIFRKYFFPSELGTERGGERGGEIGVTVRAATTSNGYFSLITNFSA
jgi:hypothetical protein